MISDDRPKDDDEEAVDKYLNVELIMNMGTNDERCGRMVKHSLGLDNEPIGHAHQIQCLTPKSTRLSLLMEPMRNTRQM
jgi:hypothetical protein